MVNAVSNSKVPHIVLLIGSSYGAGNYGMAGQSFNPRFLFGWPSYQLAVMGPEQLAGVMSIISRANAEARGQEIDEDCRRGDAEGDRGSDRGRAGFLLHLGAGSRRRDHRPP